MSTYTDHIVRTLTPPGHSRATGYIATSTIAVNLLSLALPIMTLQIYDRILPNPESGTLPMLMFGVTLAIALETALRLARSYIMGWNGAVYEYNMSSAAVRHVLSANLADMRNYGAGEHLHRMSAIGKLRDFFNGYTISAMIDLAFVPLYLGFIVYVSGPLATVPAAILMLFTLVSLAEWQRLRSCLQERDLSDDKRYNFLIETLDGIQALKAYTLEKIFSRRYEALEEKSARANFRTAEATARAFNNCTVISHLMIVATIAAGAVLVLQGQVTAGALVATLLLSGRMMQMIQRGLVLWLKYQDYLLSRDKVRSIFEVPVTKKSDAELGDIRPHGNLRAEALTYRWRDDEKPVIDNVSFELRPGDLVCIAGEEAAGKTTLLNLLAGIAPATSGEVTVDDVNIQRLSPERLTRHVGYITAEPVIFRGTIRNNITRFGELEDRYARKFAALLGIDKDVAKMPTGFDTFLQGGSNDVIPPGLRQRIAMARVLAARPRILLLDEAETALDREGYELFMSLLEKMRDEVAIIVTSEDPRILMLANRHYALRNGKLVPLPPPSRRPTPFPLS